MSNGGAGATIETPVDIGSGVQIVRVGSGPSINLNNACRFLAPISGSGSLVLTMRVVVDWALGAWVLGFGSSARVLKPRRLAERVLEQVDEMRAIYAPPLPGLPNVPAPRGQTGLPFTR